MEKIILEKPWILLVLAIWVIPWKGWALWKAARNNQAGWFVVILIVNTLALLDMIYIVFFSNKKKENKPEIQISLPRQMPMIKKRMKIKV